MENIKHSECFIGIDEGHMLKDFLDQGGLKSVPFVSASQWRLLRGRACDVI